MILCRFNLICYLCGQVFVTMAITFSILTCTYNAENVLGRTLQSVAEQSYPHVEHIIQDGASTDGTLAMVGQQKGTTHPLVVSDKDKGLYDAMNKAVQRATGDYIVFLNAGDKLHSPATLADMAAQLYIYNNVRELPAVLYGQTDIVDDEGRYLGPRHLLAPETLSWRSFSNGMLVCHQAFYVRTDIAKKVAYDLQYRLSADVDWCIRVMKEADRQGLPLHNTHMTLCDYLAGGMSIKNHRSSLMERFSIMRRHYGLCTTLYKHLTFLFRR